MDSAALLVSHVAISLVGIVSGVFMIRDFLSARFQPMVIWIFLISTTLTSLGGYLFHRDHVLPSHIVGAIALAIMIPTWLAWSPFHLSGAWKRTFVIGATISQWLNVFVLVAQTFAKVPILDALAPKGTGPFFAAAQSIVLIIFVAAGLAAWRRNGATLSRRIA
jgi:hypothetical protein